VYFVRLFTNGGREVDLNVELNVKKETFLLDVG